MSTTQASAPGELSYKVTGDDVVFDTLYRGTFELAHGQRTDRYGPGDVYVANHPGADCAQIWPTGGSGYPVNRFPGV